MNNPGYNIRLRSSARTSVGQVRENNEDNIRLWTGERFVLAVVADGMGGAAAGEEASRIAVESIYSGLSMREQPRQGNSFEQIPEDTLTEKLRDVIRQANLSIVQRAAKEPEMRGMGTTVTLALVRGTDVLVAHVGDSRAYLVSGFDAEIMQITSDHSFVEALLAAGHITREQADEHPMRNVLYRALGQTEEIDVDLYRVHLQVGDRLVLCSDGLTRHVKPHEIARLALSEDNPDFASQKLIDLANDRGGEDNVSVIVITVESDSPNAQASAEAMFVPGEDEEDTLVLKSRSPQIKLPPENNSRPRNELNTTPQPRFSTDPFHEQSPFTKQKMHAERLSDDFATLDDEAEAAKVLEQHDLNRTVPVRPAKSQFSRQRASYEMRSNLHHERRQDSDGEGRDTLDFDQ